MKTFSPNDNIRYYIYWIKERQKIFWRRYRGESPPYSVDPIMQEYKFTNVYRVLDRVSQYELRNVIYNGTEYSREDMFWRILLFKHFNSVETWEFLTTRLGDITLATPIDSIIHYLTIKHTRGRPIYSNAYMLTASFMKNERLMTRYGASGATQKHTAYMRLFQHELLDTGLYLKIINASTFTEAFNLFRQVITVGDFLTYQYVQDLNYSDIVHWDDNEFCAAGFGTIRGIERTFDIEGTPDYGRIVQWTYENFRYLIREYGVYGRFEGIPDHPPQVTDLSNCFCEVDKYLRMKGVATEGKQIKGKKMKAHFAPNNTQIEYMFPPKWGVTLYER